MTIMVFLPFRPYDLFQRVRSESFRSRISRIHWQPYAFDTDNDDSFPRVSKGKGRYMYGANGEILLWFE